MKKKTSLFLLVLLLVSFALIPSAEAERPISILVNGSFISTEVPPIIVDGRTMVPLRAVAEALGCSVSWDGELGFVNIKSKSTADNNPGNIEINGPDEFKQVINEAINKMDANTRAYTLQEIKTIIYEPTQSRMTPGANAEMFFGNTCYFSGTYFVKVKSTIPHDQLIYSYIGFLVHESTHSHLNTGNMHTYFKESDREYICDLATLRAIENAGGTKDGIAYKSFKKSFDSELKL